MDSGGVLGKSRTGAMTGIVDDLKRIPMSAELAQTLSRAADYAQSQSHDQVQLEHLLLALTEDADAIGVLSASHVDTALLKADVSLYLGGLTDRIAKSPGLLVIAADLKRILEAAAAAASQGRRRDINGAIVLAAIVGDARSPAAHMLRAQGLTFEEAIKALQRAMTQPPPARAPAPDAEDLLATARSRIQTRSPPQQPVPAAVPAIAIPDPAIQPFPAFEPAPVASAPQRAPDWPPPVRPSAGDEIEPPAMAEDTGGPSAAPQPPTEEAHDWHSPPGQPHGGTYAPHPYDEPAPAGSQSYHGDYRPEHETDFAGAGPDRDPPPAAPGPVSTRPPVPRPGSRWPAPVAPAWRDGARDAEPLAPPPLPPQWAEPPSQYAPGGRDDDSAGAPPSWPEPDRYGAPESDGPGVPPASFDGWPAEVRTPLGMPASGAPIAAPPRLPPDSLAVPGDPDPVPTSRGRRRHKSSTQQFIRLEQAIVMRSRHRREQGANMRREPGVANSELAHKCLALRRRQRTQQFQQLRRLLLDIEILFRLVAHCGLRFHHRWRFFTVVVK